MIDAVLDLESKYYYQKSVLLMKLHSILKCCFVPDLRKTLIDLISSIMSQRPRLSLFDDHLFQCYHFEIDNLRILNEICSELEADIRKESKEVHILRTLTNPETEFKIHKLYLTLQQQNLIDANFYMKQFVKLFINLNQQKDSFQHLTQIFSTNTKTCTEKVLRLENLFLRELASNAHQIIYDGEGVNLFPEYARFRFLESDPVLDRPENYDLVL